MEISRAFHAMYTYATWYLHWSTDIWQDESLSSIIVILQWKKKNLLKSFNLTYDWWFPDHPTPLSVKLNYSIFVRIMMPSTIGILHIGYTRCRIDNVIISEYSLKIVLQNFIYPWASLTHNRLIHYLQWNDFKLYRSILYLTALVF